MKTLAPLTAMLLAAPLAGCITIGAKPPPSLLTLHSDGGLTVGETQRSDAAKTIMIGVPVTSQELATMRVPVQSGGTAVAYIKDAQWVEPPARLFARLLSDTVTAQTGRVVLSHRQSQLDPGAQLTGELRAFGVDEDTHEAVVTFDASLMRGGEPVFEKRRFEARVPVSKIDATDIAGPLNQAANKVAVDVAAWVGK